MNYCKIINSYNAKFQDTFDTRKRPFISTFWICMTVRLSYGYTEGLFLVIQYISCSTHWLWIYLYQIYTYVLLMMFFNGWSLIKLNKWKYSSINKRMSNIHVKVTSEKKWHRYRNLNLLSLKSLSLGQFLESSNSHRFQNFQTPCCNLKIWDLGAKLCLMFLPIILILKGTMTWGPSTKNFSTITRF